MKEYNLVGDKLKELLQEHDKSIRELAFQTGVNNWTWSKLINGKMRLSVDLAIRLGKVFPWVDEELSPRAWLFLQHQSDIKNAIEQDGAMYMKIKPFGQ